MRLIIKLNGQGGELDRFEASSEDDAVVQLIRKLTEWGQLRDGDTITVAED